MNNSLTMALDRTLLLMRDNLVGDAPTQHLISALTSIEVALVGDVRNLSSHGAQCAFVTAALLLARSGHRVYLAAPDVSLVGAQPPLSGNRLVSGLLHVGKDLLPGIYFYEGVPDHEIDLSVSFGDSRPAVRARRVVCVNATAWSAHMGSLRTARRWYEAEWPCGALASGALIASEAFKAAMHLLRPYANNECLFDELFAFGEELNVELAPPSATKGASLGQFDFVSGGAITNAALFTLVRLPAVSGRVRVIEPDNADLSNLNRYPLLLQSGVEQAKASVLRSLVAPHLELEAICARYEGGLVSGNREFFSHVLVGVDDIPIRWQVQTAQPDWLGIGATTHWSAMASFHRRDIACARCLHPRDDLNNDRIPTVAFVSFFSGLMLACYFMRAAAGEIISVGEQYRYLCPLRPERIWRSPVSVRPQCPHCWQHSERVA